MQRLIVLGAIGALILSACAASTSDDESTAASTTTTIVTTTAPDAAESADPESQSGSDDGTSNEGETGTVSETLPTNPAAGSNDEAVTSGPSSEPGDTPPPADDSDSMVLGEGMPSAVVAAVADLAARLGVSVDVVDWVSMEEVDWPDGSLGCPQPGMNYTQAIVNGYRIVLEVDGVAYAYHGKAGSDPFLCVEPMVPDPPDKSQPGITTTSIAGDT